MKGTDMKNLLLISALLALPVAAAAQTVTRTDVVNANLININSGVPNAPSTTFTFANDGATFLVVRNSSASTVNVRVAVQTSEVNVTGYGRVSLTDAVVATNAGSHNIIGPFPVNRYNDSSGLVTATISNTAAVSLTAIRAAQ
jgi:hypothetical protein